MKQSSNDINTTIADNDPSILFSKGKVDEQSAGLEGNRGFGGGIFHDFEDWRNTIDRANFNFSGSVNREMHEDTKAVVKNLVDVFTFSVIVANGVASLDDTNKVGGTISNVLFETTIVRSNVVKSFDEVEQISVVVDSLDGSGSGSGGGGGGRERRDVTNGEVIKDVQKGFDKSGVVSLVSRELNEVS